MELLWRRQSLEDDQISVLIGVTTMFVSLVTLTISLRWLVKRTRKTEFETDDYLCFVAYLFFLAFAVTSYVLSQNGVGRRAELLASLSNAQARNVTIRNVVLAQQFIHLLGITTVKLSILFLYRRIFTNLLKWFNILWYLCVAATIVYFLIYIILLPLQGYPCPLSGPELDCPFRPASETFLAPGGAGNASMDLVILLLPIYVVRTLQMSKQNSSALIGVFLLGSAAVAVSFARVPYMQNYYAKPDATYDQVRPVLFGIAESGTAIICACLPVLRPLVKAETYRSIFSSKSSGSSYVHSEWSVENSNGSLRPVRPKRKTSEAESILTEDIELTHPANVVHLKPLRE